MKNETMQEFIKTFNFLQRFKCNEAIDQMFKKMINENWDNESLDTNKLLIITFCRTNHNIKSQLTNYKPFLEKAIAYLEEKNIQPSSILSGIITNSSKS